MHPATPNADQALVTGVDTLTRLTTELKTVRTTLAALRLPLPAANDRLDHAADLLVTATRQLADASKMMAGDFERILRDDFDRYDNAANDDDQREIAA
jgi:hypothetical protein